VSEVCILVAAAPRCGYVLTIPGDIPGRVYGS
jgi:hypothetical protein